MRRGFSLIEVLIASAILGVLAVAFLSSHVITTRRTASSETLLHSGVLAQMVIERLKAKVAMNPRFFRDVMGDSPEWSFEGTVVDPVKATGGGAGGQRLSPFFEFLFSRQAPDLCAEGNQVAIQEVAGRTPTGYEPAELDSLIQAFRDFQVRVSIEDDVDPGVAPNETAVPGQLKKVVVTVSRISVQQARGKDPLAFAVTARIVTPGDSLSVAALRGISSRFEGKTLEQQWAEVFQVASANPYLNQPLLSQQSRQLLADSYLILSGANNEALLIDGLPACVPGTTVVDASPDAQFIEVWIQKFSAPEVVGLSSSRCELAKLNLRKAAVIFDTFKRMRKPMQHLVDEVLGPVPDGDHLLKRAEKFMGNLKLAEIKAGGKGKKKRRTRFNLKLIETALPDYLACSYLHQFFSDGAYAKVISRPVDYSDRLRSTIGDLRRVLEAHLAQTEGITPQERLQSAHLYVEVAKVQQLEMESTTVDPDVQELLRKIALESSPRMSDLADYLTGGEIYDAVALRTRHAEFAGKVREMRTLGARYRELVGQFGPEGRISGFLGSYRRFFSEMKMDATTMLDQLESLDSLGLEEQ